MKQFFQQTMIVSVLATLFVWVVALPAKVQATANCDSGFEEMSGVCVPTDTGLSDKTVGEVLQVALDWLLATIGVFAILMIAIAGVMYITSGGNEKNVEKAKNMLTWAIAGLAVALLGYAIVATVNGILQGDDVSKDF
ncbi:hypothetical protein EPO05_01710 [Patescibacteria group bacterium]|nr:MAG: hypothetical protein EPO05_01710 [Patescibacteria group bacterium]